MYGKMEVGGNYNNNNTIWKGTRMSLDIISGATESAPKVMIYGLAGVGKSTLASKLKRPVFFDFEGGLSYLGVNRTPQYDDIEEFMTDLLRLTKASERKFDTIVIDSADWMMRLFVEQASGIRYSGDGKERKGDKTDQTPIDVTMTLNRSNGGYGNGKQVLENYVRSKLIRLLSKLNAKGYGICLVAHADKKQIMDADGVDVDQIVPKIDVNTMNVFVEWCDNVFYLKKDADDNHILLLESDSVALAKNRLGKTGEVNIDEVDINEVLKQNKEK